MLDVRIAILVAALARLPRPPDEVVLQTERYGKVVLDHRAHLARRAPCARCHGTGAITKIGHFGRSAGHAICRGCHTDAQRGPLQCNGCHIRVKGSTDTAER